LPGIILICYFNVLHISVCLFVGKEVTFCLQVYLHVMMPNPMS